MIQPDVYSVSTPEVEWSVSTANPRVARVTVSMHVTYSDGNTQQTGGTWVNPVIHLMPEPPAGQSPFAPDPSTYNEDGSRSLDALGAFEALKNNARVGDPVPQEFILPTPETPCGCDPEPDLPEDFRYEAELYPAAL